MAHPLTLTWVLGAKNLDELLGVLRKFEPSSVEEERLLTQLPTFGGSEPEDTAGVWSWDERRLLVGTHRGDFRIVNRAAHELGRLGGSQTSAAKTASSRENGKKGGRPRGS